ncbi:MAG: xanthine dehydrogenase family protein subunit M [Pseudorhodobacter sp.]|nr:MAG: xanthine dehydrogenase family protein subunit M [Pseudorhodobacter sp.]
MTPYARPDTIDEALTLLASGDWRALAGGTDVYPGAASALPGPVLDLGRLDDLRGIKTGGGLRIGAMTTWAEIAETSLPPAFAALQQAARRIGARQVQNVGTIGGNLCNASPAADGVPPLLVLDAEVELVSTSGSRRMLLQDFLQGPRRTAKKADELLVAVHIPSAAMAGRSAFIKLGARAHLVISIAMVAARVVVAKDRIESVAIAVGACSPVARRLPLVEAALTRAPLGQRVDRVRPEDVAAALAPLSDVRATADYRLAAATELVRRVIGELA